MSAIEWIRRFSPDEAMKVPRLLAASLFCALPLLANQTVTVGPSLAFSPSTVTVAPGETVTWVWAAGPHSTTSNATTGPETWDSGIQGSGATFSHLFSTPGSWPYYCAVHSSPAGTTMNGVVLVALPPTATPTAVPVSTATPAPPTPSVTAGPPSAAVPDLGFPARATLLAALALAGALVIFAGLRR